MRIRRKVTYRAEFVTEIDIRVNPGELNAEQCSSFEQSISDAIEDAYCDIDVPENSDSKYQACSFEVIEWEDLPIPPLEQLAEEAE